MRDRLAALLPELQTIADPALRDATLRAWEIGMERGGWKPEDLDFIPFALEIPKCDVSLLEHTRSVARAAIGLAEAFKQFYSDSLKINVDVLVSGALVHDVGKLLEFEKKQGFFIKSASGALLRHPFSGVFLTERAGLPAEVVHIVAVHSREGDGGFRTPEAIIVHHCDFAAFDALKAASR